MFDDVAGGAATETPSVTVSVGSHTFMVEPRVKNEEAASARKENLRFPYSDAVIDYERECG